ncbi:hypothetical protein FPG102_12275, partial [Flavobacterium psychrophilum]
FVLLLGLFQTGNFLEDMFRTKAKCFLFKKYIVSIYNLILLGLKELLLRQILSYMCFCYNAKKRN